MSNKIKSITTVLINDDTDQEGVKNLYEERDPQGNTTLLEQYMPSGESESRTARSYDNQDRVLTEEHFSSGQEVADQRLEYVYNNSGKIDQITVTYADGSFSLKKYAWDEAENTNTIMISDEDGDHEGKEFRKFDSEGKVLEVAIYDEGDKVMEKAEYEYDDYANIIESVEVDQEGYETVRFYDYYRDDQGRITKLETLNEDEQIIRVDEFSFDEQGNRTRHHIQNLDRGSEQTDVWVYDQNNRLVQRERLRGGKPMETIDLRYREDGLLLEQEIRGANGVYANLFHYEFH